MTLKTPFSSAPPINSLESVLAPWRAFWADAAFFNVWHATGGGLRTSSRTTGANLECAFVENALVFVDLKILVLLAPPLRPPVDAWNFWLTCGFLSTWRCHRWRFHLVLASLLHLIHGGGLLSRRGVGGTGLCQPDCLHINYLVRVRARQTVFGLCIQYDFSLFGSS